MFPQVGEETEASQLPPGLTMFGATPHPNPAVQKRRDAENARQALTATLQSDFRLAHIAGWEKQSDSARLKKDIKTVVATVNQQHADDLERRRAR